MIGVQSNEIEQTQSGGNEGDYPLRSIENSDNARVDVK